MNAQIGRGPRLAAAAVTSAALMFATVPTAHAEDSSGVDVVNTETVQVYLDSSGDVKSQRVYEQLALTGEGEVDVTNPLSTEGLRNLDGFSGVEVEDGQQVVETSVDGDEKYRFVSDFDGELPLDISIAYTLDGEPVEPGDLVGKSGDLEVEFTVENVTSQPQEVTYDDGTGGTVTETVDVPIPMVGSLSTVAPPNFTEVQSDQANLAGDGAGGTRLSFTMTLFPPIGSSTATFGYTAKVTDGVVPRIDVSALPVNPLESPTFASAAESYRGGAKTGSELTVGATEIDANLLKLRDGASDLLSGLIQLNAGAEELNAGLDDEAAPGADRLADGANELATGLDKLETGADDLSDGTGQLDDGADKLASGAGRLSDGLSEAGGKAPELIAGLGTLRRGLVKVDRGLGDLSKGVAGVRRNPDYQRLLDGLDDAIAGVGTTGEVGSLTWAVDQVRSGLQNEAVPGLDRLAGGANCVSVVLGAVINGQGALAPGANPCFPDGYPGLPGLDANNPLEAGRAQILNKVRAAVNDPGNVNPEPTLVEGLNQLKSGLTSESQSDPGAIAALAAVECGLDSDSLGTCGATGLQQGLSQIAAGVPTLVETIITTVQGAVGSADDSADDGTLRGGMSDLIDGADLLEGGGSAIVEGLAKLSEGAGDLSGGADDLADGTEQLDDGADRLAAGADDASSGSDRLADGAGDLAEGLGDAADGSGRLADGLGEAAEGAPELVDGAGRLSEEGTSKLVEAGEDTAQEYGQLVAVIGAGAERAKTESMAYGAPEDAVGLTAYSFVVEGEDGEGGRNLTRGLLGLGLLGAAAAVFALRRRLA